MIEYLKMFEKSANVFPGFEAEIQGLYREVDASGAIWSIPMWSGNDALILWGAMRSIPRITVRGLEGRNEGSDRRWLN